MIVIRRFYNQRDPELGRMTSDLKRQGIPFKIIPPKTKRSLWVAVEITKCDRKQLIGLRTNGFTQHCKKAKR